MRFFLFRIHVRVWHPVTVSYKEGDYYYSGEVVLPLFLQGMMFAAIKEGTAYKVRPATPDHPARGWRFHVPDEATDSAGGGKNCHGVITYQVMTRWYLRRSLSAVHLRSNHRAMEDVLL